MGLSGVEMRFDAGLEGFLGLHVRLRLGSRLSRRRGLGIKLDELLILRSKHILSPCRHLIPFRQRLYLRLQAIASL